MAKITAANFVDKSLKLLEKERSAEVNETRILQEQLPLKELQRRGVCLLKLHIASHHTGLYGRTILQLELYGEGKEFPSHKFTPGDIAGLSPSQGGTTSSEQLCSGIVTRVTTKNIHVAFDESYDQLDLDGGALFKLVKLANDVTYQRIKKALKSLDQSNNLGGKLASVLFGESEPGPPLSAIRDGKVYEIFFMNPKLDESQQEAVKFALQQREVAIVHGPPGTGKTTTVTEIILQAVKQGSKLLVCAPSNIAADNLVEKLSKYKARMIRLGHPARVLPSIQGYSLDAVLRNSDAGRLVEDVRKDMDNSLKKLKKTSERGERQRLRENMKHLRKELRSREDKALKEVLQGVDIILSTLTMATPDGPLRNLDKGHFDLVVIDECSQALEAACWIALQQAPRCILAGDHNQLPPTILSQEAAKEGLSLTLMERLLDLHGKDIVRMLTTQYRMHEDIMTWPSEQLYDGQLTAHHSVARHLLKDLPNVTETEMTGAAILLVDTAGCGLEELRVPGELSKGNEGEADIVTAHVNSLIEAGITAEDVAVIAPYNLQVELLRLRLSHKYPKLEIKSVDGFQGREKEAVIISLVRSNEKGEVGFLAEDRRINVAITRARRHLAVVCDTETVSKHKFLKSLVEYMMDKGEVVSAQEFIQAGALNTDIQRPDYIDAQIDRQKQADNTGKTTASQSADVKQHRRQKGKDKPKDKTGTSQANKPPAKFSKAETNKLQETGDTMDHTKYIEETLTNMMISEKMEDFAFPATLTAKDRKLVHEMCENLGLQHQSQGESTSRHIVVSKASPSVSTQKTSKESGGSCISSTNNHSNRQMSTPVVEEIGESNVSELSLDLKNSTDKTKEQSPISTELPVSRCSICGKEIPKANFELHQLRCKPEPSVPDRSEGAIPKTSKKANKSKNSKKKPDSVQKQPDEEDFDVLIAQAISDNKSCHFHKCKNSTATLGQNCAFCGLRFCLSHHIAEGHGCGDKARTHARVTISKEGKLYRGSGVPDKKPDPNRRVHLERKLENKLTDMAAKRKLKKKDK